MHLGVRLCILTLVLSFQFAVAAPTEEAPSPLSKKENETPIEVEAEEVKFDENNFQVSPPPQSIKKKPVRRQRYYPFTQSISAKAGAVYNGNPEESNDEDDYGVVIGASYLFKDYRSPRLEVGAEVQTKSSGMIFLHKRINHDDALALRYFYAYGLGLQVLADEHLATITNFENYMLRAAIGIEYYLSGSISLRSDLEASVGTDDIFLNLSAGLSWGF